MTVLIEVDTCYENMRTIYHHQSVPRGIPCVWRCQVVASRDCNTPHMHAVETPLAPSPRWYFAVLGRDGSEEENDVLPIPGVC